MSVQLVGKKCGMTRIHTDQGEAIPVTVIEVPKNYITQIKTEATDGYTAVQIAVDEIKASKMTKPLKGHFAKANVVPCRKVMEFRVEPTALEQFKLGEVIEITRFAEGQIVDVRSKSKGKGFQGGIKRWNFASQDASHGNSVSHRAPGSIGQNQSPGKVFKGKKMAGHLGDEYVTVQSQQIVRIDAERNLILIKGGVPGAKGSYVVIKPAVKAGDENAD